MNKKIMRAVERISLKVPVSKDIDNFLDALVEDYSSIVIIGEIATDKTTRLISLMKHNSFLGRDVLFSNKLGETLSLLGRDVLFSNKLDETLGSLNRNPLFSNKSGEAFDKLSKEFGRETYVAIDQFCGEQINHLTNLMKINTPILLSIQGQSTDNVIEGLITQAMLKNPKLSPEDIEREISSGIDYIIVQGDSSEIGNGISEIIEVRYDNEKGTFDLIQIFKSESLREEQDK